MSLRDAGQVVEDGTFRAVVAVATLGEVDEGAAQGVELCDAALHFLDVALRQRLDVGAGALFVTPQGQQVGHVVDREAERRARWMKRSTSTSVSP